MARITIRNVRPAPNGFSAATLFLVAFTVSINADDEPIAITRYVKGRNDEAGKEYKRGSIPAGIVRLDDVPVCEWHKDGKTGHYIQTNGFSLDRNVQDEIIEKAIAVWHKKSGVVEPADQSGAPHGQYDPEGDPFDAAAAAIAPAGNRPQ